MVVMLPKNLSPRTLRQESATWSYSDCAGITLFAKHGNQVRDIP